MNVTAPFESFDRRSKFSLSKCQEMHVHHIMENEFQFPFTGGNHAVWFRVMNTHLDQDETPFPTLLRPTRSGTACATPALNWNCRTAIWSRFQKPSECAFHTTRAAVDALPGLTGRTRRRRCPGKLIPAPAVLISLILSSAVTLEMQFKCHPNGFSTPSGPRQMPALVPLGAPGAAGVPGS